MPSRAEGEEMIAETINNHAAWLNQITNISNDMIN